MLKNVRKVMSERKGFTLVELIVVLVILSILAAMLVPSLTGYINKAKGKNVEAEIHQAVVAAQALADEAYAMGDYSDFTLQKIAELSEIKGDLHTVMTNADGKVVYLQLTGENDMDGYYSEDEGIVTGRVGEAPTVSGGITITDGESSGGNAGADSELDTGESQG